MYNIDLFSHNLRMKNFYYEKEIIRLLFLLISTYIHIRVRALNDSIIMIF